MHKFKIAGKLLLGEKYVKGRIKELMRVNEELMMHSEELMRNTDNSGHYVRQRTHNVRAHALRLDKKDQWLKLFVAPPPARVWKGVMASLGWTPAPLRPSW